MLTNQESYSVLGVSEQLKQEFMLLQETQLLDGQNKFSGKSVSALASHLVCRNYSNLCYEFSHYCWMILHANGVEKSNQNNLLSFFWVNNGHHKAGCAAFFQKSLSHAQLQHHHLSKQQGNEKESTLATTIRVANNKTLLVFNEKVVLEINEHQFAIHFSRANILACLMEWLILVVPSLLETMTNNLLGQGTSAVKELATWLQKQIYAYLGQHLQPAKLQKRYRLLNNFYQSRGVDCQSILSFWQQHKFFEGCAKYSNVLNDSIAFDCANKLEHEYANATNLLQGDDIQADSQSIFDEMVTIESIDIRGLANEPKVYNKKQLELVSFMAQHPINAIKYSQSYLRLAIFANAQSRIIQGVRDSKLDILTNYIENDYNGCVQGLSNVVEVNNQALMAMYPILTNLSCKHACVLLIKLCQHTACYKDYSAKLVELFNQFYSDFEAKLAVQEKSDVSECNLRKAYLEACTNWQASFSWFNDLIKQTEDSLKMNNRKGFTKQTLLQSGNYVQAAESLLKLNQIINKILLLTKKQNMASDENFDADRSIFLTEFSELYIQDEK